MLQSFEKSYQELARSEELYRSIVENQHELICRLTPDGILTAANAAFSDFMSVTHDQLIGTSFSRYFPEAVQRIFQGPITALTSQNPTHSIEFYDNHRKGELVYQKWDVLGFFNPDDTLREIQLVGQILDKQYLEERSTLQYSRQINAIYTATTALLTNLDLESLIGQIIDAAMIAIPNGSNGTLYLIARDTGKLEIRGALGYQENDPRIRKLTLKDNHDFITISVRERRPIIINDLSQDDLIQGENPEVPQETIHSAIVAPLILGEEALGALCLASDKRNSYNQTDLDVLASFAATVTNAINNAQLHAEVQRQAITDPMTGLYNRRGFFELGEHEIERSHRFERPLSAIMLDIDSFKDVNDNFGHAVGDKVLQEIADRVRNNIRRVDVVGRYGGDEFALLLPEIDTNVAANVGERLRYKIQSAPIIADTAQVWVTISLGVTKLTSEQDDLDTLLSRADKALYLAKNLGKNRIEII